MFASACDTSHVGFYDVQVNSSVFACAQGLVDVDKLLVSSLSSVFVKVFRFELKFKTILTREI